MSAGLALQGTCFLPLLNERNTSESAFSLDEKVREGHRPFHRETLLATQALSLTYLTGW
jgi:hypothetical protein